MLSTNAVVFLGETGVGKTSVVCRIVNNKFNSFEDSTIGAAFNTKKIKTEHGNLTLNIWDTAGQERYASLAPMYYRTADIAVIVYDLSNKDTLFKARHWSRELQKKGKETVHIVLVGNKLDLKHNAVDDVCMKCVEPLDIKDINRDWEINVSAKTGDKIQDLLNHLFEHQSPVLEYESDNDNPIKLTKRTQTANKCYC